MSILGSLERFLTVGRNQSTEPQPADTERGAERATDSRRSADLYRCPACETTYISTAMETCPECRESVETVPNEHDLGIE